MRWTVPLIIALSVLAVPAWAQSPPQQSWSFSVSTESNKKKGDWVDITVIRAKRRLTLRAQLDRDPAPALAPSFGSFGDWFRGLPGGELQLGFPDAAQPERFDQRLRELEKRFDELRKRLDEKRDGKPSTT